MATLKLTLLAKIYFFGKNKDFGNLKTYFPSAGETEPLAIILKTENLPIKGKNLKHILFKVSSPNFDTL